MAYAGENFNQGSYGTGGSYAGNASNAVNPMPSGGLNTEQAAAALVLGSLVALIAIRRGFRGLSVGRATGGLLRG